MPAKFGAPRYCSKSYEVYTKTESTIEGQHIKYNYITREHHNGALFFSECFWQSK
jgi:hypothetical protein